MGATPKLIPKRKLISPTDDNQDVNNLLQHVLNNQQSVIPQVANAFTISGGTPTLNFVETDQTDPAGRWRFVARSNSFVLERQLTVNWATTVNPIVIDVANEYFQIVPPTSTGYIRLEAAKTAATSVGVFIGQSTGTPFLIRTSNGAGSNIERFYISAGAATVTATFNATNVVVGNNFSTNTIGGQGTANLTITGNLSPTDATERSLILRVINATADTFLNMITLTPSGATPTMSFNERSITSVGNMTCGTGTFYLASGPTSGDVLQIRGDNSVFISCLTSTPNTCTVENITMSGTWLANGTVTIPALTLGGTLTLNGQTLSGAATFDGQIISTVAAGSPFLKANATSDVPTATWGAAAGNEVSAAPSGWLEIQDGSSNTRYIPFWA